MSETLNKEDTEKDKKKKKKPAFEAGEDKPSLMTHRPEKSPVVPPSAEVREYEAIQAEAAKRTIDKFLDDDDDEEKEDKKEEKKQASPPPPVVEEAPQKPAEPEKTPEAADEEETEDEPAEASEQTQTADTTEEEPEAASQETLVAAAENEQNKDTAEEQPASEAEEKPEDVQQQVAPESAPDVKPASEGQEAQSENPASESEPEKAEDAPELKESGASEPDPALKEYETVAESSGDPEAAEQAVIDKYELDDVEKELEKILAEDAELASLVEKKAENLDEEPSDEELDKLGEELLSELESTPEESGSRPSEDSEPTEGAADTSTTPEQILSAPSPQTPAPGLPAVPPGMGGGGGGGGGQPGSPEAPETAGGAPAPAPELGPAISEKRKNRRKVASAGLLGGLIGYYFGKKAGRRQQEAKMKPDQDKLEKENTDLKFQISEGEKRIRRLRHIQEEQAKLSAQNTAAVAPEAGDGTGSVVPKSNETLQPKTDSISSPEPDAKLSVQTPELAAAEAAVVSGVAGGLAGASSPEKPEAASQAAEAGSPESVPGNSADTAPEVSPAPSDEVKAEEPQSEVEAPESLGTESEVKTETKEGVGANFAGPQVTPEASGQEAAESPGVPKQEQEAEENKPPEAPSTAETIDPFGLKAKKAEQVAEPEIENFYQTAGAGKYEKPSDPHPHTEASTLATPEKAPSTKTKAELLDEAKEMKVSGENIAELFNGGQIDEEGLRRIVEAFENDGAPELVLAQERHKIEKLKAVSPEVKDDAGTGKQDSGLSGPGAIAAAATAKHNDTPQDLPKPTEGEEGENSEDTQAAKSPYAPKDYSKRNKAIAGAVVASLLALLLV